MAKACFADARHAYQARCQRQILLVDHQPTSQQLVQYFALADPLIRIGKWLAQLQLTEPLELWSQISYRVSLNRAWGCDRMVQSYPAKRRPCKRACRYVNLFFV